MKCKYKSTFYRFKMDENWMDKKGDKMDKKVVVINSITLESYISSRSKENIRERKNF